MSVSDKAIRGFKWVAGAKVVGQIFNWCITIFVIRLLDPTDYGIFAIALVVTAFLTMLSEFGMGSGIVQKKEFREEVLKKVLGFVIIIDSLFFLGLYLGAPFIANFYEKPLLVEIFHVQAFQFLLVSFVILPSAKLRYKMRFKVLSLINLVASVAGGVVTLILAIYGFGVWSLVLGNISRLVLRVILVQVAEPTFLMPDFRVRDLKGIGNFGGIVVINRMFFFAYTKADILIIGKIMATDLTGIYSIAKDLATLPMAKLASSINVVAFSAFTKYDDKRDELKRHYLKALDSLSIIAFPVFVGIASIAPELVPIALGETWVGVIVCLQIIAISVPFRLMNLVNGPLLEGIGLPGKNLTNTMIAMFIFIPSFYIAVDWGIVGVATVWMLGAPLFYFIVVTRIRKSVNISYSDIGRILLLPLTISAIMFFTVRFVADSLMENMTNNLFVLLSIDIVVGALVYLSLVLIFDKARLIQFVRLVYKR